jgi:uncharacterized membrane protein
MEWWQTAFVIFMTALGFGLGLYFGLNVQIKYFDKPNTQPEGRESEE